MSESIFGLPDDEIEPPETPEKKLEHLKNATHNCVTGLLYYDRKEDEDLSVEDIEELLQLPDTKQNIIKWFTEEINRE